MKQRVDVPRSALIIVPLVSDCWIAVIFRSSIYAEREEEAVELNVHGCRVDILGTNCDQCLSMVQ